MSGPTNDAAAADQALRAAHGRLLGDDRIQFELPDAAVPVSRPPPDWLRGLLDALGEFLRFLGPFLQIFFYVVLAAIVCALVYLIITSLMGVELPSFGRKKKTDAQAGAPEWRPDEAKARVLLEDADQLAGEGRYAEAARLLLHRSLDDVRTYRPTVVKPALTSRELAVSESLPDAARQAFSHIARVVETSYFGSGGVDQGAYAECRRAYEAFAFPAVWT